MKATQQRSHLQRKRTRAIGALATARAPAGVRRAGPDGERVAPARADDHAGAGLCAGGGGRGAAGADRAGAADAGVPGQFGGRYGGVGGGEGAADWGRDNNGVVIIIGRTGEEEGTTERSQR